MKFFEVLLCAGSILRILSLLSKIEMGWPFLAAAKSAASLGAAMAAAKGAFSGLRGRFKATRGTKRRGRARRAVASPVGAGVR